MKRIAKPATELLEQALQRLDRLEAHLADEHIDELVLFCPLAGELLVDGVPKPGIIRDRQALRALINKARAHYRGLLVAR